MREKKIQNERKGKTVSEIIKDSLMVIITLIFVLLYAAAFTGKLDPLKDNTMMLRLDPLIFILIGFYFGRFPSRQNEISLKDEIARQTQKADVAQYAKEKVQIEREMLEEKIKNARTALKAIVSADTNQNRIAESQAFKTAVGILDS